MKNKLIKTMRLILAITVIVVAAVVFTIVFSLTTEAMYSDMRQRATGVKEFIIDNLYSEDFIDIGGDSEQSRATVLHIQKILDSLHGVGNLSRLYIAAVTETGEIVTTLETDEQGDSQFVPTGRLERDLHESIRLREAVYSSRLYETDDGRIYSLFWPVFDENSALLGVVGMEFDAEVIYASQVRAAIYSAILSIVLILLISCVSYISMNKATAPFYKKLAYTDILTGCENRMAFEHKLRVCNEIALSGKSVTVFIFDVNNLKALNDALGHEQGDLYLKHTADALHEIMSGYGPLYRIGGDEFASLIIGKKQNEINDIVKSLRNERREVLKGFRFSCAFGCATFTKNLDETMRDVLKRADEEMYEEKQRQKVAL